MKNIIPATWRLNLRVFQRYLELRLTGKWQHLANKRHRNFEFLPQIHLAQPLGLAGLQHLERKKHNLNLAIDEIQNVVILPGQIFSFWHLVGNPSTKAGYVEGRTITKAGLATSIGGGLCQLSGMIYFLALKSGFKIIERHPHSKDIYTDATRFAPLGSDATVVYGYKDLQLQNPFSVPICFQFEISDRDLQMAICSPSEIVEVPIEFRTQRSDSMTVVDTIRYFDGKAEFVSSDCYPKLMIPAHLS